MYAEETKQLLNKVGKNVKRNYSKGMEKRKHGASKKVGPIGKKH